MADRSERPYQQCTRCIVDTTVPGTTFDTQGQCSYCKLHDAMCEEYPNDERGKAMIEKFAEKIRRSGKNNKYDCVMGISGGRDSTYSLYLAKKEWGLRPLAVHFNDGFGNPQAGENMRKATKALGIELRTITSDWRESKDIKIAFLKASTPDMEEGTDLGIASTLYGVASKENVKYIVIGQSFRTEGISPLEWNYLDGRYLKKVHQRFGTMQLREWQPDDPGFNLDVQHMFYYTILKRIRTVPLLYHYPYVRKEAEAIISKELGWVYPGAHYYDDLYQSLMAYVFRVKFNIDRRKFNYSALIRSGQMERERALALIAEPYVIEDEKVINLCIKRLGITREQFDEYVAAPPKTFRDYPSNYRLIRLARPAIKVCSLMHLLPKVAYDKYFKFG